MNKKIIIATMLVLTLLLLMPTSATKNKIENIENEYETLETNTEIITFIDAFCPKVEIKGFGLIREAELIIDEHFILSYIRLHGIQEPLFNGMGLNIFQGETYHLTAPKFIGYKRIQPGGGGRIDYVCRGIALGDIEWS